MKKISQLTAFLLAAGLLSAFPTQTFALTSAAKSNTTAAAKASEDNVQMENAIKLVRSRISIPEDYSKFTWNMSENKAMPRYDFYWANAAGESYSASVEGNMIISYNAPNKQYTSKASFSPFTAEEIEKKALDWLYTANPSLKSCIALQNDVRFDINSGIINLRFKRINGSLDVNNNSVNISLNKATGEVRSMHLYWWYDAQFTSPDKALSQKDIEKIYSDEVVLKPWYRINTDENNKRTAQIVYVPTSTYLYDAVTGKHSTMSSDYSSSLNTDEYSVNDAEDEMEAGVAIPTSSDSYALTNEEQAATADMSKLLTSEKFKALMIKDKYMGITNKFLVNSYDIYEDKSRPCGFIVDACLQINNSTSYSEVYITADAQTGEVISFDNYSLNSKAALDVTKATALAEEAAKYYYGDIFAEYRPSPDNSAPAVSTKDYTTTSRTMTYYRYVNNIQVTNDSIEITVNSNNLVTNICSSHTVDVDFGDGKIISQAKALEILYKNMDFELFYDGFTDLKSVPHTYLLYSMPSWAINAQKGIICNYFGDAIAPSAKAAVYTDISKSPYKAEIEKLQEYGVNIYTEDKFMPNTPITQTELMQLLNIISTSYYFNSYDVEYDITEEVVNEQNTSALPTSVTRMDMIKLFIKKMDIETYAQLKGIYKSPFSDVPDSSADVGYAALAYALGFTDTGDNSTRILPNTLVTREYAYHCIYNYIANNS